MRRVLILVLIMSNSLAQAEDILVLKADLEWRYCPSDKPIKGNINLMKGTQIYHLPKGQFYDRTNPEACFKDEFEAEQNGFRKSER